jgi:DNA polymerase III subunit gamma/tau
MAYQSLYRRYRPQKFSELRGQEHLVAGLQNAVRGDRVAHAYLFSGPRGTGKTSTARILAKVLNCANPVDAEPCGVCDSCVAIESGTSFDVHELDAASNNGVEAIRDLITKTAMGTGGRTKVYILDEVHMLSTPASNALLKTLEETPAHVVFVLATTDPQKVLPTIRSRTQHYELHLLSAEELTELAEFIIEDAGLEVPPGAVDAVVRAGAGSARDMESSLDQVAVSGQLPDDVAALDELVDALCDRDSGAALVAVERAIESGRSPRLLGEQLISRLRDIFLTAMKMDLTRLPDRDRERVAVQAERLGPAGTTRALEVLGEAFVGIQDAPDQRIPLEVALVRLTRPEADTSITALVDRVARLERGGGSPPAALAPSSAVPASGASGESESPAASASAGRVDSPDPTDPDPTSGAPTDPPSASSSSGAGDTRPAAGAREALQARKRERAGTSTRTPAPRRPSGPPAPPTAAVVPPPATPSAAETPAAAAPVAAGELPTRDELTLAWGDSVLTSLPQRAKSRYAAGRFLEVTDGAAVFALPNPHHARRCEECRAEVEAALGAHFGRPVPLKVVVDDSAGAGPEMVAPEPPDDEDVDLTQLTDADDVATSSVERVRELFPGAELVDEG